MRIRIVGRGRAGGSFAAALADVADVETLGRGEYSAVAEDADVVLLAVPDRSIAECAADIAPGSALIAHVSGATGLGVLAPHGRVASLHPLVSMPDPVSGAQRLRGAWMAISGDPLIGDVAALLGGRTFSIGDGQRALYHATAAFAANHVVALMSHVERLAEQLGVPAEAFFELADGALANVRVDGARAALTGPVARGDWDTVRRHLGVLDRAERRVHRALIIEAARLAGRVVPRDIA